MNEMIAQQLSVAKTVLSQAVDLLDNYLVSDQQLTVQSRFLPGSTIGTRIPSLLESLSNCFFTGKHLRHARDHFVLLIACISNPPPRVLSYDTRIRDTPMETNRTEARIALMDTIKQLEKVIPTVNFQEQISLHAVTPHLHSFQTTIGREVTNVLFLTVIFDQCWTAMVHQPALRTPLVDGEQDYIYGNARLISLPRSAS